MVPTVPCPAAGGPTKHETHGSGPREMSSLRRLWHWVKAREWLLFVIACFLAVTVPLAIALPAWLDEAYSLRTSSRGVWGALKGGMFFELQAPAYFGLLSLWRKMGSSPEFARMLSVLLGAASLVVCARISRLLFPKIPEACLPALVASHPLFLFASLEIRVYATAILLSAVLVELYVRAFLEDEEGKRGLAAFALVATIAIYTQYYLGFLLASFFPALLLLRRGRAMGRYLLAMGIAGLLCTPFLFILPAQLAQNKTLVLAAVPALERRELFGFLTSHHDLILLPWMTPIFSKLPFPGVGRPLYWLFRLAPWGLALIMLLRRPPIQAGRRGAPFPGLIVFGCSLLALTGLGMLGSKHLVSESRYWTILVVPGMVALLGPFALCGRRTAIAVSLFFVCSNSFVAWGQYRAPTKFGDGKRIARYIMESESPGQPIVVFPSSEALVLEAAYRGVNPLIPLPFPQPFDRFDIRNLIVPSEASVEETVGRHVSRPEFLWLVIEDLDEASGYPLNRKHVVRFFERSFLMMTEKVFDTGVTVRLYRRSPTGEALPDNGEHRP
jgi:hypothetical protein